MLFALGVAVGALTMQTWDGREITMSNYDSRNGTVIVFFSSRCPDTQRAIGELLEIHERFRRREVLFVGLSANDAETAEEMKAFSQSRHVNFPVYRDKGGVIAGRFGAKVTLEAFLLDAKGVLVYRGGFHTPEETGNMATAIQQLLAGVPVEEDTVSTQGTPLAEAGAPGPSSDPIGPLAFASEVVFEKVPWAADHHCSTLAEAPNGDLLCVWFGGSFECADDQVLYIARRKARERMWSTPEVLTRGEFLRPPGNAVIFRVNPARLMVYYDRMEEERPIRNGRWRAGQLKRMYSEDSGLTWSKEEEVHLEVGGIRNAPFTLRSGVLMVPMSNPPSFLATRDGGATWERTGAMDAGGQPTAIERSDGSLLCYLRAAPYILQSESQDGGKTWSPTKPSTLPCPGAGMAMCRLQNGHLVLVYNSNPLQRTPLSVALSTDDGATWSGPVHLESNPGEYAYPCVIETSDGRIHASYTFLRLVIKHAEFDERWIQLLGRSN
ncbi:MAG: exo-alpha-sialidase [Candidatus Hydrogenedentes bacterium]|nr:exo-alpha-sialidase [Candidatus Hydrogenedentota bacterium]